MSRYSTATLPICSVLALLFLLVQTTPLLADGRADSAVRAASGDTARDKRAFLTAASKLGHSVESDTKLISAMAASQSTPEITKEVAEGAPIYRATAHFAQRDRLTSSVMFTYRADGSTTYRASTSFVLEPRYACISADDLTATLGPPAEIGKPFQGPHTPRDARTRIYATRGVTTTFTFYSPECAGSMHVAVITQQ